MYRKKGREKTQKVNSFKNGRGGFTLVELCVVMALIVIMTVMTVTFSVLVNSHASDDMAAYDFLEDSAKIEDLLCDWIAENDKSGTVFSLTEQTLTATADDSVAAGIGAEGILYIGNKQIENLDSVDIIKFNSEGKLIKCTLTKRGDGGNSDRMEVSFVFALRCATITGGDGNE